MENLTLVGMKELNQKLSHIDRSLEDIAKSLSTLAKIANRQFPQIQLVSKKKSDPQDICSICPFEEDDDEV